MRNMNTPNRLLVARGPKTFGPKAKRSGRQGKRNVAVSQCGTLFEISGSWKRLMTMPSSPNTPQAAMRPLEYKAPGLASLSSFFFVVASTNKRTRPPANMAPVVAIER